MNNCYSFFFVLFLSAKCYKIWRRYLMKNLAEVNVVHTHTCTVRTNGLHNNDKT